MNQVNNRKVRGTDAKYRAQEQIWCDIQFIIIN